jgi:hypothetical protein
MPRHVSSPSSWGTAQARARRRHRRSPAEAERALAGERSEPGGLGVRCPMHCSVESGSRAETAAAPNYSLGRFSGSSPPNRSGQTAQNLVPFGPPGRHDPAEDPAAAEDTPNAQPTPKPSLDMLSAKDLAATQTDFGPDGFRSSNPATPASQSGLLRQHAVSKNDRDTTGSQRGDSRSLRLHGASLCFAIFNIRAVAPETRSQPTRGQVRRLSTCSQAPVA